jgi:hypothetical protein
MKVFIMENKCNSCLTFIKKDDRCNFDNIIKNKRSCPCRDCIIKVTCEHMCDKFKNLVAPDNQWKANPHFIGRMMV